MLAVDSGQSRGRARDPARDVRGQDNAARVRFVNRPVGGGSLGSGGDGAGRGAQLCRADEVGAAQPHRPVALKRDAARRLPSAAQSARGQTGAAAWRLPPSGRRSTTTRSEPTYAQPPPHLRRPPPQEGRFSPAHRPGPLDLWRVPLTV